MKMNFVFKNTMPWLLGLTLLVIACQKTEMPRVEQVDLKKAYHPLQTGNYIIYEVEEITYDNFFDPIKIDTNTYELKEQMDASFIDNEDEIAYQVKRYVRDNDTLAWKLEAIWQVKQTETFIEKVEDNLRFIKLVFPPVVGKEWQGNGYLNYTDPLFCDHLGDWDYTYQSVDEPYSINNIQVDSSVTVIQIDDENLICKNYSEEVYGKHIGLLYKKWIRLTTQTIDPSFTFIEKAEQGFILTMKAKNYYVQ